MTQWTRNSIRQQLSVVGHYCTITEWTERGYTPSAASIVATYGSWRAAWADAGCEPPNPRTKIIDQLRKAERYWTAADWDRAGHTPHSRTVRRHWGSWDAAWADAGITPTVPIAWTAHPQWTSLDPTMQTLWLERSRGASLANLADRYALSREGIRHRLRQIERVLQGQAHQGHARLYSLTTVIDMLQRWHQHTGRWPTRQAWTQAHQQPSAATIVRYFGSWRRALQMAAFRGDMPSVAHIRTLTIAEASQRWHFSPRTVHRLIRLGAIPAQQLGHQWVILVTDSEPTRPKAQA